MELPIPRTGLMTRSDGRTSPLSTCLGSKTLRRLFIARGCIRAAAEVANLPGRLALEEVWTTYARRRLKRDSPEGRCGARGPETADRRESSPTRG